MKKMLILALAACTVACSSKIVKEDDVVSAPAPVATPNLVTIYDFFKLFYKDETYQELLQMDDAAQKEMMSKYLSGLSGAQCNYLELETTLLNPVQENPVVAKTLDEDLEDEGKITPDRTKTPKNVGSTEPLVKKPNDQLAVCKTFMNIDGLVYTQISLYFKNQVIAKQFQNGADYAKTRNYLCPIISSAYQKDNLKFLEMVDQSEKDKVVLNNKNLQFYLIYLFASNPIDDPNLTFYGMEDGSIFNYNCSTQEELGWYKWKEKSYLSNLCEIPKFVDVMNLAPVCKKEEKKKNLKEIKPNKYIDIN